MVVQDEGKDEEWHSKEHSNSRDDVDEMFNLTGNRGLWNSKSVKNLNFKSFSSVNGVNIMDVWRKTSLILVMH